MEKYNFHENMVILKRESGWDGIGFFGQSGYNKTPLSFGLGQKLFDNGKEPFKIFDDCFNIEDNKISQCRSWGSKDLLGYRDNLLSKIPKSQIHPNDESFLLDNVTIWLLVSPLSDMRLDKMYKKEPCTYEEFLPKFIGSDPLTWSDDPRDVKMIIAQSRFSKSWNYFIIYRERFINELIKNKILNKNILTDDEKEKVNKERTIIDNLIKEAYVNIKY